MVANLKRLPRHCYTLEEYFALEKASDARFEYWDGDLVCVNGTTPQHYILAGNIHFELAQEVHGKGG